MRDPENAVLPVVRVSFFGVQACARHYEKRLPTEAQWKQAVSWLKSQVSASGLQPFTAGEAPGDPPPGHMHMMDTPQNHADPSGAGPPPAMNLPLADPAMHVREWAVDEEQGGRSLVVSWPALTGAEEPAALYRSEGFAEAAPISIRITWRFSKISR